MWSGMTGLLNLDLRPDLRPVLRFLGAGLLVQLPSVLSMPPRTSRPIGPTQPLLQLDGLLVQLYGPLVGGELTVSGLGEAVPHPSQPVHPRLRPDGRGQLIRLLSAIDVHWHLNRPCGRAGVPRAASSTMTTVGELDKHARP
jgi:hypothetical protein